MNIYPIVFSGRIRLRFLFQTLVAFVGVGLLIKYTYHIGIERLKDDTTSTVTTRSPKKTDSKLDHLPISSDCTKKDENDNSQDPLLPIYKGAKKHHAENRELPNASTEIKSSLKELKTNSETSHDMETTQNSRKTLKETNHNTEMLSTVATVVSHSSQEPETASYDLKTAKSTLSNPQGTNDDTETISDESTDEKTPQKTLRNSEEISPNAEEIDNDTTEVEDSFEEQEGTSEASHDMKQATVGTQKETSHNAERQGTSVSSGQRHAATTSVTETLPTMGHRSNTSVVTVDHTDSRISCGKVPIGGLDQVIYSEATESNFKRIPPLGQTWSRVKPATTPEERDTIRILLDDFKKVCELNNITNYFIFSGTLLGSYRHHGLQPWDDDIDILMQYSNESRILDVFRKHASQSKLMSVIYLNSRMKLFHRTRSIPIPLFEHRWPFLDISFYYENQTHIWEMYVSTNETYHMTPKAMIFPLHLRPFEGVMINSPRDGFAILKSLFTIDECVTLTWIHRSELAPSPSPNMVFSCKTLAPIYPFVHRKVVGACVEETLRLNDTVLYTMLIEEPSYAIAMPFRLQLERNAAPV